MLYIRYVIILRCNFSESALRTAIVYTKNMVRDEYPAPEEEVKEEEMVQEIVQPQENNLANADEQMELAEGENHSNGTGRSLECDVFSDDIGEHIIF